MNRASRLVQAAFFLSLLSLCWMLMQLVHELGHITGAWLTGGSFEQLVWHPMVFSRTDFASNPAPLIVVWAGPILGSLIPLLIWFIARRTTYGFLCRFFAGFCLVANGAYIGFGSFSKAGDCQTMLVSDSPLWTLWLFGICAVAGGFTLWNGQGCEFGLGPEASPVSKRIVLSVVIGNLIVLAVAFLLGNRG